MKLQSGGTNASAKQLLVSVGRSTEEEESAGRKEGRTKRGIARCCETSVSGGTNATAKQLLVSVGRSKEEEERA